MKAILQVKSKKEIIKLIEELDIERAHWYYYGSDEGLREEVEDLVPFYEEIIIVVDRDEEVPN